VELTQFQQAVIAWNDLREDDYATAEQYQQWAERYGSYLITVLSLAEDMLEKQADLRTKYEILKTLVAQDLSASMFRFDPRWQPRRKN
jgi:hypothetical protein